VSRDRLPPAVALATVAAFAGMAAVSAGLVPDPGFDEPAWYLLVAASIGYWLAVVRLTRSDGDGGRDAA
jgi:hypothetical protein